MYMNIGKYLRERRLFLIKVLSLEHCNWQIFNLINRHFKKDEEEEPAN